MASKIMHNGILQINWSEGEIGEALVKCQVQNFPLGKFLQDNVRKERQELFALPIARFMPEAPMTKGTITKESACKFT